MPRGPSIAKILATRNLKAVKLRFDVRVEHTWTPPTPSPKVYVAPVKREEAVLNPLDTWMP